MNINNNDNKLDNKYLIYNKQTIKVMYISSSEMRAAGRADLSGRWGESAMLTFVLIIITCFVNGTVGQGLNLWFAGLGSLTTILLLPMGWGYSVSFLINHRGAERDPFDLDCLFTGYKKCSRIFTTLILKNLIVVLGLVLLIVPGIYFALAYAMTDYLLFDNPELKNQAALRRSKEMMAGHKTALLWLWLSFIGWASFPTNMLISASPASTASYSIAYTLRPSPKRLSVLDFPATSALLANTQL